MSAKPVPGRPATDPRHAAAIVAGISFLFPGSGHLLIGEWARGLTWAAGLLIVTLAGGGLPVLVLMVIAAVDACAFARRPAPPPEEEEP